MNRGFRACSLRACSLRAAAIASVIAVAGCGLAANDDPDPTISDDTRARLAQALQASGDPASASAVLQRPASPAAPDPLRLARALIAAGQVDQGLEEAKARVAAHRDDLALALDVGRLALGSGRPTQAADIYRQILLRHPDNVEALNGKGVVLAQQGDLTGAAESLRQALAHRPQDVPVRNNLALVLALNGQTDLALSMLEDLSRSDGSSSVKATLALVRAIRF